jgi:hypothetical protein
MGEEAAAAAAGGSLAIDPASIIAQAVAEVAKAAASITGSVSQRRNFKDQQQFDRENVYHKLYDYETPEIKLQPENKTPVIILGFVSFVVTILGVMIIYKSMKK